MNHTPASALRARLDRTRRDLAMKEAALHRTPRTDPATRKWLQKHCRVLRKQIAAMREEMGATPLLCAQ